MYKNDYHQKSIGKLVTLPFTAKVQGKWWNAESNKLCLHHFNIPSLDIIPVLEMIYFFTMNSIPWRWGGNKKYIIKRTLSNIRGDGLVRLLWDTAEVWVYYICILRITSSISTSSTSSQKSLFIHQQLPLHSLNAKHTSIGYQDTSSTVHIQSHFFNTLHVQNFQRVNQSALASPQKRFSITDMLLQACYTFCRSDWQHLDTTI